MTFRDIIMPPSIGERKWSFWQYCNRGRIKGIDTFVDINVFSGTLDVMKERYGL
jgi:lysozyme